MRSKRTPTEVRADATRLARIWASERDLIGDTECAGELRDLAKAIGRIRLTKDRL